jgi:hypothetical protein
MTVTPLAVFTADFPDDQVEDARDIVLYGGRNVAGAIGQRLSDADCEVSGLLYEGLNGWTFVAKVQGQMFSCQTTSFHPKYFLDLKGPSGSRPMAQEVFAEFWQIVDTALRSDDRVHDLCWYRREDAPDPWEDVSGPEESLDPAARAALVRQLKAQGRQLRRERLTKMGRYWLAGTAIIAGIFGLSATVGGVARRLGGAADTGGETAAGLLIFALSSLVLLALSRGWKSKAPSPQDSPP